MRSRVRTTVGSSFFAFNLLGTCDLTSTWLLVTIVIIFDFTRTSNGPLNTLFGLFLSHRSCTCWPTLPSIAQVDCSWTRRGQTAFRGVRDVLVSHPLMLNCTSKQDFSPKTRRSRRFGRKRHSEAHVPSHGADDRQRRPTTPNLPAFLRLHNGRRGHPARQSHAFRQGEI